MRFALTPGQLAGLKEHKYRSEGRSLLERCLLDSFWQWLVRVFPLWVAPNTITLIGFVVSLVTTLAVILSDLNAEGKTPKYIFLLCAFGLFFYQTLDGMDGKQARRIGLSTPLGEFFDHGLDALVTFLYCCVSMCTVGVGPDYPILGLVLGLVVLQLNYFYHWQTFVCGVLHFKTIDIAEAHYAQIIALLMSGVWGTEIWTTPFPGVRIPLKVLVIAGTLVFSVSNLLSAMYIILTRGVGKNGSTVAGTSVLSPIISPLVIAAALFYHAIYSPSQLVHTQLILFFTAFALPCTKTAILMMIAGMTKTPYPLLDPIMVGPFLLCANMHFPILPDMLLTSLVAGYAVFDIVQTCVFSLHQISTYLEVPCFSVPLHPSHPHTSHPHPSHPHPSHPHQSTETENGSGE